MTNKIRWCVLLLGISFSHQLIAQSVELDNSFNEVGVVIHPVGNIDDEIRAITIQPDGRIVAAGLSYAESPNLICAMARYLPDGTLDGDFFGGGAFTDSFDQLGCSWQAVALQADMKIVVAGYARDTVTLEDNFGIARYNSDGSPDNTFGSAGKIMTDFFGSADHAKGLIIQQDGKIVVAGSAEDSFFDQFMVAARYHTDGSPDETFGTDGKSVIDFGIDAGCTSVVQQPDGKFILCGYAAISNSISNLALARINADGTLDETFSADGIQVISTAYSMVGESIVLQNDGRIVVGGHAVIPAPYYDFAVVRILANGDPDPAFSEDGIETTAIGDFSDDARALVIQQDGKIVLGGSTSPSGLQNEMALVRYNGGGTLDPDFGIDGKLVVPLSPGFETIYALKHQPDGKLVAGGFSEVGDERQFTLLRFTSDLSIGILDFEENKNELLVYPNPIRQEATMYYELQSEEEISIELLDMQGRMIRTFVQKQRQLPGKHNLLLPMDAVESGNYIIQVSGKTGSVSVRIVKQ